MSGRWIVPFVALLAGCATQAPQLESAQQNENFGVLVMAHGGGPQWNKDVLAAVEPLKDDYNVEVAFGMADASGVRLSSIVRNSLTSILASSTGVPLTPHPFCHDGCGGHRDATARALESNLRMRSASMLRYTTISSPSSYNRGAGMTGCLLSIWTSP